MQITTNHHFKIFKPSNSLPPSRRKTKTFITTNSISKTDSQSNAFWDYNLLFFSQRTESPSPIRLKPIIGTIPPDFPFGTYYLIGPGLFSDDHGSTVHPLDGHGYLRSFEFSSDGVKYAARYVSTEAEREERSGEREWRFTYRGPFSVLRRGRKKGNVKVMKNVANTCVLYWFGRLFCLWEGGDPYEIDPRSLDTIGLIDLMDKDVDSMVNNDEWKRGLMGKGIKGFGLDIAACLLKPILHGVFNMPPKRLLAHYKIDVKRNRLLMLSCNAEDMLLPRSTFTFVEFDCDFKLIQKREYTIQDHLMIHDWAFTDTYYILIGNRIKLDIPGSILALCGMKPMITALSVNPTKSSSPVYLLPRFSSGNSRNWREPIEAPSQFWAIHFANAFEQRDNNDNVQIQLQVSACSYRWFNFHRMFGYDWHNTKLDPCFMNSIERPKDLLPHLKKVSITLNTRGECTNCIIENLSNKWKRSADFTIINPKFAGQKNNYIYTSGATGSRKLLPHFPFDSVLKLNTINGSVTIWSTERRMFVGEPIFVSKNINGEGEEDDGYILVVEYAVLKQKCHLVMLDAKRIGKNDALIAKFEVPKNLRFPFGFHGFWANKL
ncbi:hypothetical protein LUZ60_016888 [Juncus effusus]|nr:hypothetical protein LUZ60_016888 [Juncus effusus]